LRACHQGLVKQRLANFTPAAFRTWGQRLHGSRDKESWERLVPLPALIHPFI